MDCSYAHLCLPRYLLLLLQAEAERRMNAKKEHVKNQRAETASSGIRSEHGEVRREKIIKTD